MLVYQGLHKNYYYLEVIFIFYLAFAQGHLAPIFDSTRSLGEVVYNPVDNSFYGADITNAKQFKKI